MATHRILVIDDDGLMREFVEEALTRAHYAVETAAGGEEGFAKFRENGFDVVITDLKMTPVDGLEVLKCVMEEQPNAHVIVMTAYGTIETAVTALKEGAEDYILKPFAPDELELAVARALERGRLRQENRYLRDAENADYDFGAMVGESGAMAAVYEQIRKVADSPATVLIRGESGTGKELVARAIHYSGARREQPFIKVNCAALSAGLLESELFGHEKGAFTGAHEKKFGRFELADGGTLLLDEVSEIGIELQPKLLRALQEREFERVGGAHTIQVDTRIVATSNMELEQAVSDGRLREDLFFRLNVIPIHLPPLRQRKEDIPALIRHFIEKYNGQNAKRVTGFSPEAEAMLLDYDWPGNVRELENAIERAVVLSGDPILEPADIALGGAGIKGGAQDGPTLVGKTVAEVEKELILKTLEDCNQNRTQSAKMLGISVRTLRNKLKEYHEDAVLVGGEE